MTNFVCIHLHPLNFSQLKWRIDLKKIIDNIYSFTIPLPFTDTPELNIYYIDDKNPTIIDTGLGDQKSIEIFSHKLKQMHRSIKDISFIVNTHEHIEHYGGDRKLREISGAHVIASIKAAPHIENAQKVNSALKKHLVFYEPDLANEFNDSIEYDLKIEESKVDVQVNEGDIIDTGNIKLRVISTPGHSNGHICLYDEKRKILFAGDNIIDRRSTFVGYDYRDLVSQKIIGIINTNFEEPDNLSLYIDSLKKLLTLDIEILLPSHGRPVREPHKKLELEIKKKERRSGMFLKVLGHKEFISLKELTSKVYGKKSNSLVHCGAALGYLARLNREGIIEARMNRDDLYLKLKTE